MLDTRSAVLSGRKEGIAVPSAKEPKSRSLFRASPDSPECAAEGMCVKGVEYGGLDGGRKSVRAEAEADRSGKRRWKSACVSGGEARWKCAGGRSCKTTLWPLRRRFRKRAGDGSSDVLQVPFFHQVVAHGVRDEEMRIS